MSGPEPRTDAGLQHRRGLRFRRRDDYAVELFRDIAAHLADTARVNRALLELSRFYNPLIDGPIVDLSTRRRIVELLERDDQPGARRILDERLRLYARMGDEREPDANGSPGGDADGGTE